MRKEHEQYRYDIDGLRAVAVSSVIFCHAGLAYFKGGFVGVDVFFVISGYLITTILDRECRSGTFSLVTFYERRARRLMPAFFAVMATSIPFAWAWLSPTNLKEFGQSLGAASLFASNIFFYLRTNYFAPLTEFKPLLHMWSLSVEEQYYVIFPFILIIGIKVTRRKWGTTALVGTILLISLASAEIAQHLNQSMFAFYLLPTRAWELMAGALVALTPEVNSLSNRVKQLGSTLGLAMVTLAIDHCLRSAGLLRLRRVEQWCDALDWADQLQRIPVAPTRFGFCSHARCGKAASCCNFGVDRPNLWFGLSQLAICGATIQIQKIWP
jgi:peptidoglycan/LPS O-acetylase OafA/YrhL